MDRKIDIEGNPAYESLRKYGIKAVELWYKPDRDNRLESVDGETVIMTVQNSDDTEHILKMRIENSGHLEEIQATATTHTASGAYLSEDASRFDLDEMQRIANAIELADS